MYTKEQVDDVLSQVEVEFEKALDSITKNEEIKEEVEVEVEEIQAQEEDMNKSEEVSEEEYSEEDFDTIDEIYSSMSKSEKEAHYSSIKKSLFSESTEEDMSKSEEVEVEVKADNSEIEMVKSENTELKKNLEQMNTLLEKMFDKTKKAPAQKAITGYSVVAKSEEMEEKAEDKVASMSKSEITSKLKSIDYSGLNKSERNAINEYCLNNGSVNSIKHLITE